jgi:hypothetical protein
MARGECCFCVSTVLALYFCAIFVLILVSGIRTHINWYEQYKWNTNAIKTEAKITNVTTYSYFCYVILMDVEYNITSNTTLSTKFNLGTNGQNDYAKCAYPGKVDYLLKTYRINSTIDIWYQSTDPNVARIVYVPDYYIYWLTISYSTLSISLVVGVAYTIFYCMCYGRYHRYR